MAAGEGERAGALLRLAPAAFAQGGGGCRWGGTGRGAGSTPERTLCSPPVLPAPAAKALALALLALASCGGGENQTWLKVLTKGLSQTLLLPPEGPARTMVAVSITPISPHCH